MKKIICIVFGLLIMGACSLHETSAEVTQFRVSGDTVYVTKGSDLARKLKAEVVKTQPFRLQITTAGVVKAIPTQYAEIAPPFPGRVLKSYVTLGMKVTPETALFEISSPDFIGAQKLFLQAKSQMLLAEKTYLRQQDLMKNGVGIQKDLEEAETAYNIAKTEYANAEAGIRIFKADPDKVVLGQPLIVKSPINGEIVDNKIVVGQFISDNAASVATVAELSQVWVSGKVKEKDIRFVHEGDEASIDIAALPDSKIRGDVYRINKMVDEDTRSVDVYVVVDNKDGSLKKGMYATIQFSDKPTPVILISPKSVFLSGESPFTFLQVRPDTYIRKKIETSGNDEATGKTVVKVGLKDGDKIISEGGYYLMQVK